MGDLYRDLVAEYNEAIELDRSDQPREVEFDEQMNRVYEQIDGLDDSVFEYLHQGKSVMDDEGMTLEERVELEAEILQRLTGVVAEAFSMADVLNLDIRQAFARKMEVQLRASVATDANVELDPAEFVDCVPFNLDEDEY